LVEFGGVREDFMFQHEKLVISPFFEHNGVREGDEIEVKIKEKYIRV
jgi:hypothetical protein